MELFGLVMAGSGGLRAMGSNSIGTNTEQCTDEDHRIMIENISVVDNAMHQPVEMRNNSQIRNA